MGFFDKLFGNRSREQSNTGGQCPACGAMAVTAGSRVRCSNPSCRYFDASLGRKASDAGSGAAAKRRSAGFAPETPLVIRYRNFRNEEKSFTTDATTIERKKNHLSVQVAPSGERIALSRPRILNLAEVEEAFPQRVASGQNWPSPKERQVLNYHKKYGSTSPLYQKIRAKYPNW